VADVPAITRLAVWLGEALGASADLFADFSTGALGVALPDTVTSSAAVRTALGHAATAGADVTAAAAELETAAGSGNDTQHLEALVAFGAALSAYFTAIAHLAAAVDSAIDAGTVPDANERAAAQALAAALAERLADAAAATAIMNTAPELMYLLRLLGLADWGYRQSDDATALSTDHVEMRLHLERLQDLFSDPAAHFRSALGWGTTAFDPSEFFAIYRQFFTAREAIRTGTDGGDPFIRHGDITVRRASEIAPPGLRVQWDREYVVEEDARAAISEAWGATLSGKLTLSAGASALIRDPLSIDVTTAADASGEVRLYVDRNDGVGPVDLLGGTGLLSIRLDNAAVGLGITADWNPGTGVAAFDALLFAAVKGATLVIGSSDSDSFVGELLAGADVSGTFDLTAEWAAQDGLRVQGSGGFEIRLPLHKSLGFAALDSLYIALYIAADGTLQLETSAAVTGRFGPLTAAVDRLGARLDIRFADDADAGLGLFDVHLGFKPPSGLGLSIDAGAVSGGGYLYFDPDNEEYAGALELDLVDLVTVKAIGLITTRLPDGSKGFSLVLIVTAEFGTGIQLGFGFTLLGVGGILGLNRTMRVQPLMEAVRTGAIQSVMFPADVVANAARIISDLLAFFPPERGVFLIGPMAKIGWGTPPLLTLSLGVIIEIPGNTAILGVLRVVLPDEQAAVIRLQVNFVGAIESDKKRAWLFAGLFESRILNTTIEGEMGVLLAWGAQANFVVSVGGFHPQFQPPPLPFTVPQRITTNVLDAAYGRIRIAGYFAVTSNTVQFGARAELHFGISSASVDGHVGFDALFEFNPFHFVIDISASVEVKLFGLGLFSISLRFTLGGPSPWRATGYGEIGFLFWSKKITFDFTWGPQQDTSLPPIQVMPLLVAEYEKLANWRAVIAPANSLTVSLRALPAGATAIVLHPLGRLAVSQRAAPLDIDIDRVGSRRPSDAKRCTLSVTGDLARSGDVDEAFAIGQFQDFDDATKLSKPAFEPLPGGLEAASPGRNQRTGNATKRNVRYETIVLDRGRERVAPGLAGYPGTLFTHFLDGNAASRSAPSRKRRRQLAPFDDTIVVAGDGYIVASSTDNTAYPAGSIFSSQVQADSFLAGELARDPSLAGSLHVIPAFEMATP
jgi:hypothetical protein